MNSFGKVVLVGAPSSGKSTLFNRLTSSREAITSKTRGVTRDRKYGFVSWLNKTFTLIDTGGVTGENLPFQKEVQDQVEIALNEADVIVFVVDGRVGITKDDFNISRRLFKIKKPVILVVNKIDDTSLYSLISDFYSLGFSDVFPISSEHGLGLGDFLDRVNALLPDEEIKTPEGVLTLSLIGRPNVGKSSLANKIIGYDRVIVSSQAGTTRDSVDIFFQRDDKKYVLIDTAGVKRPGKVLEDLDKYSVIRTEDACYRSDIILLLIDASEGIVSQDIHVSSYAVDNNKPVIIVVNKWDLHSHNQDDQINFSKLIKAEFKFLSYAPIVYLSAKTGSNINSLFKEIDLLNETLNKKVPSSMLNSMILKAQMDNEAPDFNGGRLKISYCTQIEGKVPTFILFVNNPNYFHFSYRRYLENSIRETFGFENCPIKLIVRSKRNDLSEIVK